MSKPDAKPPQDDRPAEPRPGEPLLPIVRAPRDAEPPLELDMDEVEVDRRYGREDIADK